MPATTAAIRRPPAARSGTPTSVPPMTISDTAALDRATRSIACVSAAGTVTGVSATTSPATSARTIGLPSTRRKLPKSRVPPPRLVSASTRISGITTRFSTIMLSASALSAAAGSAISKIG